MALNYNLICIFKENGLAFDYEQASSEGSYTNDALFENSKKDLYMAIFNWGFEDHSPYMGQDVAYVHRIAAHFVESLARDPDIEITRHAPKIHSEDMDRFIHILPFAIGAENINEKWIRNFYKELEKIFNNQIKDFSGTVYAFLKNKNKKINVFGRIFFHLVENSHDPNFPFAFLATYSTKKPGEKKPSHIPLKNALIEYKKDKDALLNLLSTVNKASGKSLLIKDMVDKGEIFSPLKFTSDEAYAFLKEIPIYEECGIVCRIPGWWKKSGSFRLSIEIGGKGPSEVGRDALLSFEPKLYLGDEQISREEIEGILTQASGLRMIKGKWIEADPERLSKTLKAFDQAMEISSKGGFTLVEAMRMQLSPEKSELGDVFAEMPETSVERGKWLEEFGNTLKDPKRLSKVDPGKGFHGTLRHYQQTGLDWLQTMRSLKLGALLADDMGLGKTVQILALLEHIQTKNKEFKALLIVPASVMGNWEKEISRFTPYLKFSVLHGNKRKEDLANVYITSYGMVSRIPWLKEKKWDILITDEAQAIKNPMTNQSKIIKKLDAEFRAAMTGTPIENRLSELWSIFDYINPGLLGNSKDFSEFIRSEDEELLNSKIRDIVSPFILRRLKTDKTIIADLPEKLEIKEYTSLTRKQAILYKQVVEELSKGIHNSEGIQRKGIILAQISKLKQICNHPDQFMGLADFDPQHSGKFGLLEEICETIKKKRERVLVFTQFRQMADPLSDFLENIFGRRGLVLHGGTSVKKRTGLVEQMNGEDYIPYMVLSLKAGGVGLNLTGASHVIHFDRWWNPAVENQATDRAFRIGQKKNVMVHKFITTGTVEEKIDAMIERKLKFAGEIIQSTGEKWITEMSNEELMELFTI